MSFFNELVAATDHERSEFLSIPFLIDGADGRISLDSYVAFLTLAYYHVRHTLPLLMACGGRLPQRLEWLRTGIAAYIEEETGHQEWILNDIEACGADAEAVRHGRPELATELMVAYAYDFVHRKNPVGLFGMVFVLEGTSVRLATRAAEALQSSLDLPQRAFSYLLSHGSLDVEHIDFLENLINRLDRPDDKEAVIHLAKVIYGDIFRALPHQPSRFGAHRRRA
jgi:pyrroloquinoline quinone (PQQ) biosynthesis protein C